MTVDLQCEGDRRTAQALRDDMRRHAVREELRRVRVAQPVQRNALHLSALLQYVEGASDVAGAERRTCLRWEAEILSAAVAVESSSDPFRIHRRDRSLLHAAQTLERLRGWKGGIRSYQERWIDTTSPFGEAMFGITAVWAQLERAILRERVKAGMERARREGRRLGRPKADMPSVARDWPMVRSRIESGEISQRAAARLLRISEQRVRRRLAAHKGALRAHSGDRGLVDGQAAHRVLRRPPAPPPERVRAERRSSLLGL